MDDDYQHHSHLFTIRVWLEPLGDGQQEARSRARHVLSGETCHFRHLSDMAEWLAVYCNEMEQEDEM